MGTCVDNVVHGLSLAAVTGRRLGGTPFLQVSTTWAPELSGNGSPETMCDDGFKSKYIFLVFSPHTDQFKKPILLRYIQLKISNALLSLKSKVSLHYFVKYMALLCSALCS